MKNELFEKRSGAVVGSIAVPAVGGVLANNIFYRKQVVGEDANNGIFGSIG